MDDRNDVEGDADGGDDNAELIGDENELDRAREAIDEASEHASGRIHEQLESLTAGIFEEEGGHHTQDDPGPKVDRIAEVAEKLDALAENANEQEVREGILAARDHLRQYMKDHPQGG